MPVQKSTSQLSDSDRPKPLKQQLLNKENILLVATIAGVIIGIVVGVVVNLNLEPEDGWKISPRTLTWVKLPGELFLRALKLLILPLIATSLINAIVDQNPDQAGRMGLYACLYYLTTTLLAVVLGMIMVTAIQPGSSHVDKLETKPVNCEGDSIATDTLVDLLLNLIPDNLVTTAFQSTSSCAQWVIVTKNAEGNYTGKKMVVTRKEYESMSYEDRNATRAQLLRTTKDGMNVLGLVLISLFTGVFIVQVGAAARPLADIFQAIEKVTMAAITFVIWLSPVGIAFLVCEAILGMDDLGVSFGNLALYMATVIGGLFIHSCVVLPLLLLVLGRRNPLKYSYGMIQAYLTAFGTSSSSATLPVTTRCLIQNNKVHPQVVKMVIPLGATVNMDGTALYEAVAAIYILQATGASLNFTKLVLTSITATLASVGAAGIPQAGIVTMIMVLISIDVNPQYIALILPVDWFLGNLTDQPTSPNVDTVQEEFDNEMKMPRSRCPSPASVSHPYLRRSTTSTRSPTSNPTNSILTRKHPAGDHTNAAYSSSADDSSTRHLKLSDASEAPIKSKPSTSATAPPEANRVVNKVDRGDPNSSTSSEGDQHEGRHTLSIPVDDKP